MPVPHDRIDALLLQLDAMPEADRFDRLVTEALETGGNVLVLPESVSIDLHGVRGFAGDRVAAVACWLRRATEIVSEDAA